MPQQFYAPLTPQRGDFGGGASAEHQEDDSQDREEQKRCDVAAAPEEECKELHRLVPFVGRVVKAEGAVVISSIHEPTEFVPVLLIHIVEHVDDQVVEALASLDDGEPEFSLEVHG